MMSIYSVSIRDAKGCVKVYCFNKSLTGFVPLRVDVWLCYNKAIILPTLCLPAVTTVRLLSCAIAHLFLQLWRM